MSFDVTVSIDCTYNLLTNTSGIPDKIYTLRSGPSIFTFNPWSVYFASCGTITYTATYNGGINFPILNILTFDPS